MTPAGRKAVLAFEERMDLSLRQFAGDESIEAANEEIGRHYDDWNGKRISRFRAYLERRRNAGRDYAQEGK